MPLETPASRVISFMLAASKPSVMNTRFAPSIICPRLAGSAPAAKRPCWWGIEQRSSVFSSVISVLLNFPNQLVRFDLDMRSDTIYVKHTEPIGSINQRNSGNSHDRILLCKCTSCRSDRRRSRTRQGGRRATGAAGSRAGTRSGKEEAA
ncbi:protein of unknown function [Pseudorhizobium banfieldiae]|uniref:Uncharacterized protein n=1 Tax=Pseudorhizobium banfieldiae TaxID=1125847 RepID=L0NHJ1_9HYPH|nr:protein of unknown function [Pseudorhizobium banfieldiae]